MRRRFMVMVAAFLATTGLAGCVDGEDSTGDGPIGEDRTERADFHLHDDEVPEGLHICEPLGYIRYPHLDGEIGISPLEDREDDSLQVFSPEPGYCEDAEYFVMAEVWFFPDSDTWEGWTLYFEENFSCRATEVDMLGFVNRHYLWGDLTQVIIKSSSGGAPRAGGSTDWERIVASSGEEDEDKIRIRDAFEEKHPYLANACESHIAIRDLALNNIPVYYCDASARHRSHESSSACASEVPDSHEDLQFLSVGQHDYFGGNTQIHGTITVEWWEGQSPAELVLEVLENGMVVAEAPLTQDLQDTMGEKAGEEAGRFEVEEKQLLFELPAAQATRIDQTSDGFLTLRAKVTSHEGHEDTHEFGHVEKLVRYTADNRYLQREALIGGDDWVTPSVRDILERLADAARQVFQDTPSGNAGCDGWWEPHLVRYGHLSKMNAGPFPPHSTHNDGLHADVVIFLDEHRQLRGEDCGSGVEFIRDGPFAEALVRLLNAITSSDLARIEALGVTFGEGFDEALGEFTLNDGRAAGSVIRNWAGHTGHLHLQFSAG